MKRLAAFLFLANSLLAAETVKEVRFDVLIVRLPEASAVALSPQLRDPSKIAAAQEKLIAQLGKEVELVDWPTLTMLPGQQAIVENIDEIRYPTDFESPDILLDVPKEPTVVPTSTAPDGADGAAKPAEKKDRTLRIEGDLKLVGGVPTSFEIKNAGVTFQVEPTLEPDGKHLRFNCALQHVQFLGTEKNMIEVSQTYKISIEQPKFRTLKTTTIITATSGQPVMLSFHKLRDASNRVELAICTATIVDTGIAITPDTEAK